MKQTAVEWLIGELTNLGYIVAPSFGHSIIDLKIKQAKEMEKQQLNIARIDGINLANKGYGTKGSDETFAKGSEKQYLSQINTSQTEISDEEIRKQGIKYDNQALSETPIAHFMEGAFWYREQLKQKQ